MCTNLNHIKCTKGVSFLSRNICLVRQALIQGPYSAMAAYIFFFAWVALKGNGAALYTDGLFIFMYSYFMPCYGTIGYLPASGSSVSIYYWLWSVSVLSSCINNSGVTLSQLYDCNPPGNK